MKNIHWVLVTIILTLVFAYGGYYLGKTSTMKKVNDLYTVSPESAYALISDRLHSLDDRMILSYFMRGVNIGLSQFTTDEIITHVSNQDLKDFLKQQQEYLMALRAQRQILVEKNPELSYSTN